VGVRQENSIKTSVWTIKQGKTTTVQVDSTLWTCWHLDSFGPWTLSTSLSLHGFYFKHVLLCLRRTFCYFKLVPTQLHTHIKKKVFTVHKNRQQSRICPYYPEEFTDGKFLCQRGLLHALWYIPITKSL